MPLVWQGWLVLAVYLALVGAIVAAYPPRTGAIRFAVLVALATALLTFVCWLTGEPPRWSWGQKSGEDS